MFLALIFRFALLFIFYVPSSFSDPEYSEEYAKCSAKEVLNCGEGNGMEIKYPFNTNHHPSYCGYPGLVLECKDDSVRMNISERPYQVNMIDYAAKNISLVDLNYVGLSCPRPTENITVSELPAFFDYSNLRNVTLLMNCSSVMPTLAHYEIPCLSVDDGGSSNQYAYYWLGSYGTSPVSVNHCKIVEVVMNESVATDMVQFNLSYGRALQEEITVSWTVEGNLCRDCINWGGVCIYNDTSSEEVCMCPYGLALGNSCPPKPESEPEQEPAQLGVWDSKGKKIGMKTIRFARAAGVTSIVLLAGVVLLLYKRRQNIMLNFGGRSSNHTQNIEELLGDCQYLAPKRYKFSDIKRITKSFSEKLGEGGYGSVYKGALDDGRLVAVKLLSNVKGNGEEFVNEVASIGRTSHVNIVTLIGFCFKGTKRALIYDFMPNGSLERYIYSDTPKVILGWDKLYQIAIGVARGLEYLHRGCNTRIVHFDIKPHNILLDRDFCPKISDFGLAKLSSQNDSFLSMAQARGTIGFIAPEVFLRHFGHVSTKSDVYSYGMLVLEMAGGRRNVNPYAQNTSETYFPDWVYEHLDENDGLQAYGVTTETSDIARKIIIVGLWCIQLVPTSRPSISRVIEMLEGRISDLEIPPKPLLSSESFQDSST